jgi:hypothetical protein
VLLSRKGGTHFEEATRVNDSGGFPYDRHGHGREPVKADEDHDESEIDGSPSGRQIDRQVGIQEKQDEPHESQSDPETGSETHQETDAQTHQETDAQTQTDKETLTNRLYWIPKAQRKLRFFFRSLLPSDERAAG